MPSQNRPPSAERARHNPIFSTNPLHKNDNEDTGNENITSPGIPLLPAANKRLIRHPTSAPAMMGEHLPQAEPEPGQSGDRVTGFDNETAIERVQRRDVATSVERERLLGGIDLAWATLFSVSHNRKVTMLEGALARISPSSSHERRKGTSAPGIGENVYEVLNRLRLKPLKELLPPFFEPLESVLNGRTLVASQVSEIGQFIVLHAGAESVVDTYQTAASIVHIF